jgi:hypothetical protein
MSQWRIIENKPGQFILQKNWFGFWSNENGMYISFTVSELKDLAEMKDAEEAAKKGFQKKIIWISQ